MRVLPLRTSSLLPTKKELPNSLNKEVTHSPEKVYLTSKIDKFNEMEWKQERYIMITNKYFYNLKAKVNIKRKIKILAIEAITKSISPESLEFVLHVPSEYDYRFSGTVYPHQ